MFKRFKMLLLLLSAMMIGSPAAPKTSEQTYTDMVPRYDLAVKILPEAQRLEVRGTARLPAASAAQEFIPLLLSEQMRDLRVEVLEPAASAGLAQVAAKGKSAGRVIYVVIPPKAFPPNQAAVLRFSCTGGEKGGFVFHLGTDGSYAHGGLSAWYPLFDAGEYTGHTGTLRFSVAAGQAVVSSGKVAGTPAEMARGNFRFEVTRPTIFSFAAGNYRVVRRPGRPSVAAYQLRPRPRIDEYLMKCSKILDLLGKEFGPYPQEEFSLVEIPTASAAGFFGASSPGLIFIPSAFIDSKFDYSLHGHEISHQWWGGIVGVKGAKGGELLTEGMAQYGSLLTVERLEGSLAASGYRRTGYPSIGKFNFTPCEGKDIPVQSLRGYLMLTATGDDQRLDSLKGSLAHSLAVSKGFLVLDLLSRTVGRPVFRASLAKLIREHAYQSITWEEFLQAVAAGRDMKWFNEQWFERTGAPDLNLTWKQEKNAVRGNITQSPPFYRVRVEVQIEGISSRLWIIKSVDVSGAQTEFTLPVGFRVRSVTLDPQFLLPRWTPEDHAEADAIKGCAQK